MVGAAITQSQHSSLKSVSVPLHLSHSGLYYMEMEIGSTQSLARIALDTMSACLTVSSELCINCNSKTYKPGMSRTTHDYGLQWQIDYPYSNIYLKTIQYSDSVWLNYDVHLSQFDFYAIYEQQGLPNDIDGLLGITTIKSEEPSFIVNLRQQGIISKELFGLYLSSNNSEMILGDYNCTYMQDGCDGIQWLEISNSSEWQIDLTHASLDQTNLIQNSYGRQAVIHPGIPHIGLQSADYAKFMVTLDRHLTNFECDQICVSTKACEEIQLDHNLFLQLGGQFNVTIPGRSLLQDINQGEDRCSIAVTNSGDRYILGNPFLQSYYTIFDIANSCIGLAVIKAPTIDEKNLPIPDHVEEKPEQKREIPTQSKSHYSQIIELTLILIMASFLLISIIYYCKGRSKKQESMIPKDSSLKGVQDEEYEEYRNRRISAVRSSLVLARLSQSDHQSQNSNYLIV